MPLLSPARPEFITSTVSWVYSPVTDSFSVQSPCKVFGVKKGGRKKVDVEENYLAAETLKAFYGFGCSNHC